MAIDALDKANLSVGREWAEMADGQAGSGQGGRRCATHPEGSSL
jgi:hypothetical protein